MKRDDDYLWDAAGNPDPEVQQLERLLGRYRYDGAALKASEPLPAMGAEPSRRRWLHLLALAAALGLAVAGLWLWRAEVRPLSSTQPALSAQTDQASPALAWDVERLAGSPAVDARIIARSGHLAVGQWLETDAHSRARIDVPGVGFVEVAPRTKIGLKVTGPDEHRLAMERGEMHALVSAPPRLFFVDTPAATAVDLGCAYTLTVDDSGGGRLHVTLGYVALEGPDSEVVVPAQAVCEMRPGRRIGTPYVEDAPETLLAALRRLDFGTGGIGAAEAEDPGAKGTALTAVLAQAQRTDDLTLWHLARHLDGELAERVRARMTELGLDPAGWRHWESVMTWTR